MFREDRSFNLYFYRRQILPLNLIHITKICLLKILPQKKIESFQIKTLIFFHISAQNIDYGHSLGSPRRGGSNEYPQSIFLSRNKNNNVYPCKLQFYYMKVGFKGVKIIWVCFRDKFQLHKIVWSAKGLGSTQKTK